MINDEIQREISEQALRVISIMEDENMNATQFAEAIGIQRAAMSHLMKGRNNPSADVLYKIIERFDTINARWLLSGKGSMRNESHNIKISSSENDLNTNYGNNEPDLFNQSQHNTQMPSSSSDYSFTEENIRKEAYIKDEKSSRNEVEVPDNVSKIIEKEVVIYKERPVKTIDKLLIFYSDNTYETFIPEKHG